MPKPKISAYLREHLEDIGKKKQPGPYLTISRQYGCDGYELGLLLIEKLNERYPDLPWKLYFKELLKQLSDDTGLAQEMLERERVARPSVIKDFLRGLRPSNVPDGYEIRKSITVMVRMIAFEGNAIIVGQGGTAATADIDNGLSVRIEASREWRIARISTREHLSKELADEKIHQVEIERQHLREIYKKMNPNEPAFDLVLDNSVFTKEKMADLILLAMEQRGLIARKER